MKLSYEDHDKTSVLTMSGEFTVDQADSFRRSCHDRFTGGVRDVVVDLENLRLVDSAGLESLLWLRDETTTHGGQLRLVRPDSTIRKILEATRLERRFEIHESIESAARSLRA